MGAIPGRQADTGGCTWRDVLHSVTVRRRIGDNPVLNIEFEKSYSAFENAISSASLREVARHWRGVCGENQLPSWNDLRPSAIKSQLAMVWCYDYDRAGDDFIGRLAGQKITRLSDKPFKGARLSEIRPNDKYPRSLIRARRVVHEPALYCGQGLVYKTEQGMGWGERIVMPLRQDGTCPAGIFGATEFQDVADWKNSPLNLRGEDEQWFSLAGLVAVE